MKATSLNDPKATGHHAPYMLYSRHAPIARRYCDWHTQSLVPWEDQTTEFLGLKNCVSSPPCYQYNHLQRSAVQSPGRFGQAQTEWRNSIQQSGYELAVEYSPA